MLSPQSKKKGQNLHNENKEFNNHLLILVLLVLASWAPGCDAFFSHRAKFNVCCTNDVNKQYVTILEQFSLAFSKRLQP